MAKPRTTHIGDLTITAGNANSFEHLEEVTGSLYIHADAQLLAPSIARIAGYDLPTPEVAAERIRDVAIHALMTPDALDMSAWHTCATTHCIAGLAIHLAGPDGYKIEKQHTAAVAGAVLLGVDAAKMFHVDNAQAREWLQGKLEVTS